MAAVLENYPELKDTNYADIVERYVEPYQHVFHTQRDIDNGLVEPAVEVSKGEEAFYKFQEEHILPLHEKERNEFDVEWEMRRLERVLDECPENIGLETQQDIDDARVAMNAYKQLVLEQDVVLEQQRDRARDDAGYALD